MNELMPVAARPPVSPAQEGARDAARERTVEAAGQFEALLMAQILKSARQSGSGWLGGGDAASESATEYAEQQLASLLARGGGLGLARLIAEGLGKPGPAPPAG